MALDAVCLRAITEELREQLLGVRVDKVQQPAKDQVILLLRGGLRLLLTAGNNPRIQLTGRLRDNPAEPPMFCMLLRKHLVGARIAALTQPGLERLVELELDVTDDFGQPGKRTLVLEAIGRHSNVILLDGERRIMECLRRVDAEMSAQRPVLPGLFYQYPPAMEKPVCWKRKRMIFSPVWPPPIPRGGWMSFCWTVILAFRRCLRGNWPFARRGRRTAACFRWVPPQSVGFGKQLLYFKKV